MTNKRPSFAEFKKKALEDKEVKAAYDLLEPEFALLEKSISEDERWLLDPANKEVLARIKESLQQEASFDLGSLKQYAKTRKRKSKK